MEFKRDLSAPRHSGALVDEMRRFANRQAYDEEPLPHFHSEAVDFRAASEWFAPFHKPTGVRG